MIKVNLYVGKKPFQLPVVAGIDLAALNIKGIIVAVILMFIPDLVLDGQYQQEIEQAESEISAIQLKLKQVQKEERSYGSVREEIEELKRQEGRLADKLVVVRKIIKQKRNPMKILLYVAENIPADIWLQSMEINGTSITIKGESKSYKSIGVFIENLKSSVFFGRDINIKQSQTKTDDSSKRRTEIFELIGNIQNFG